MTPSARTEAAAAALARHDGYLWQGDTEHRPGVIADLDAYRTRVHIVLAAAGLHAAARPGRAPDLIDRDGDRWYEVAADRYWMEIPSRSGHPDFDRFDRPAEGATRAMIELNGGPLVEVPRRIDRLPITWETAS